MHKRVTFHGDIYWLTDGVSMHKRVTFRDETYWLTDGLYKDVLQLSPLEHYDAEGKFIGDPFEDLCFALVIDGKIIRFEKVIGDTSQIKDVIEV